jgi:LysR family transcriptional regulator, transcriptional activator of the cysJI operon
MQLETAELFCELARTHSLTLTARHFHLSPATVLRHIELLEKELGVELFVRPRKRPRLTPDGRVSRRYCRQMAKTTHRLDAKMERAHELAINSFDLAVCFSIGFHQLPGSLGRFQAAHPAARIDIRYADPEGVHELVGNHAVHLGLTIYPQHLPGLVIVPTRDEPLMFVCHPQHPFAVRSAVQLRQLEGQPFIAHKPAPHPASLEHLPSNVLQLFEPREEFSEVEMVVRMVETGAGVALLPRVVVQGKVMQGTVAAVPLAGGHYVQPQAILHRASRPLTPLMQQFIEHCKLAE